MLYRLLTLFLLLATSAKAQYSFRGEVKDDKNNKLSYVRIYIHSTGEFYQSGPTGNFGIPSNVKSDSATFSINAHYSKTILLTSDRFEYVELTPIPSRIIKRKDQLLSVVRDKTENKSGAGVEDGETYSQLIENDFVSAASFPVTGFSLNVDKASYSNIRRFINTKVEVPADAIRIEEILNYFPQGEEKMDSSDYFKFSSVYTDCPWNPANKLLLMKLRARKINFDSLPPSNLVFLIDISGSMDKPNRLPLLKTAFRKMVDNLRPVDTISIVAYGGAVIVALPPTPGHEKKKILDVVEGLVAGGETPGEHALNTAYALAKSQFIKDGNNRIILATDGDFNVGRITEAELMELVSNKQQMGIYLTCLGVGVGNYKDSKLELMAKKGNGNFAYIDNTKEAEKVLVMEITQTLYAVVNDAYLDVRFDPRYVNQYRLIGYDNKKRTDADSTNILEGGEIGSGHVSTAIFEITPNPGFIADQTEPAKAELSYIPTGQTVKSTEHFICKNNYLSISLIDSSTRFSIAAAMFGMLLKKSPFLMQANWDDLQKLALTAVNPKDYWQAEFLTLISQAEALYGGNKKRKRSKK
jgi:Ca-activated chloride channel family protein